MAYPFDAGHSRRVWQGSKVPSKPREQTSLKYVFPVLAGCAEEVQEEYIYEKSLIARAGDKGFKKTLRRGLLELFRAVRGAVDRICRNKNLEIEAIAVTIPAHWTLEFEDVYRDVLSESFDFRDRVDQIFFVSEIEAIVHTLVKDHPGVIGLDSADHDYLCLFQDFGGHSSVSFNQSDRPVSICPSLHLPFLRVLGHVLGSYEDPETRRGSEGEYLRGGRSQG